MTLLGWIALSLIGAVCVAIAAAIICFLAIISYALAVDDDTCADERADVIKPLREAEPMGA